MNLFMSPKDLCTVDFLDQVVETGISVFKIEGRGRTPEYVKAFIDVYREALDAIKNIREKKLKSGWDGDFRNSL